MPYVANQYNYATPLSGAAGLTNATPNVADTKYFTLFDNVLDGSYRPITGDVGLWGTSLSDANGQLSSPFVVTVTESLTINAFRIVGSQYCFPIAFTVSFYNGSTLLYTITETANTLPDYIHTMASTHVVTHYTISISKISAANSVARLYNLYNPACIKRVDTLRTKLNEDAAVGLVRATTDTVAIRVEALNASTIRNSIQGTRDTCKVLSVGKGNLTNVHTRMKEPSRRIYGKVYITYTDPMLDSDTEASSNSIAYNSNMLQLLDNVTVTNPKYFTLYENNLTGEYIVSDENSQVGWTSKAISDANGSFATPPYVQINFSARPVVNLPIHFDTSRGCVVENFTVVIVQQDGTRTTKNFTGNTSAEVIVIEEAMANVVSIIVTVTKVSKPGYPASILDIPVTSTLLYVGYDNISNLVSIDLLEELTYEDDVEALGGVSANEITVVLDNSNKDFYFNNKQSLIASQLRRNRKIVPWLGVEIIPGEIEWYTLGTFWSYKWDVPVRSLTATVVGFDTIGLLGTTSFTKHQTLVNKSLGDLIEYVLNDAKSQLNFTEYSIASDLYDIVIPYAWFDKDSHAAALRKISTCYPMHIYCDRLGRICAAPQKLHLDYYYDTWADDTNVIDKSYSSLHTTLPNIVNVTVKNPVVEIGKELAKDEKPFVVNARITKSLQFSSPYLQNLVVTIDCDSSVSYTYEAYSWGIDINFTGNGTVRSIACVGNAITISDSSIISREDANSVHINGAITRDVSSDFIQTTELASIIINRIFSLSEYDKYDASVNYRGDIALSINDPIRLLDGIAPDNRYNIKRHQLSWNGALTGAADLNT